MTNYLEYHEMKDERKFLKEMLRVPICVKRSGVQCEKFCREENNSHAVRRREQPLHSIEANCHMDHCKPPASYRRNEGSRKQHHQGGNEDIKIKEDGEVDSEEGEQHCGVDKKFP